MLSTLNLTHLTTGGFYLFQKELMNMCLLVGYPICGLARVMGYHRLYFAARHSLRSGRPELFLKYLSTF
jgi:hypothetical protein